MGLKDKRWAMFAVSVLVCAVSIEQMTHGEHLGIYATAMVCGGLSALEKARQWLAETFDD